MSGVIPPGLNRMAGGGCSTGGGGELQRRAVVQGNDGLDGPLSERPGARDHRPPAVLEGAGDDLGR